MIRCRFLMLLPVMGAAFSFVLAADKAFAEEALVIGCSTSLSGPLQFSGSAGYLGGKAYFEKLNSAGGINGRKITMEAVDDAYQPEKTLENLKKFEANPHVIAAMTNLGTANALAAVPFIEKSGFPFLFPIAGSDRLRSPIRDNVFLLRPDYQNEAEELIAYANKKLQIKEFGLIYQADGMGEGFHNGFMHSLGQLKIKPVVVESYDRQTRNYSHALEQILKLKPPAIYFGGNADAIIPFVTSLPTSSYKPVLLFSSTVGASQILRSPIVKMQTSGVYATDSVPLALLQDLPVTRQLKEDLHAIGTDIDQINSQVALEGYIGANVVAKAIKSIVGEINRASLKQALNNLADFDLGGLPIHLDSKQHVLFNHAVIYEIKDGKANLVHAD